MYTSHSILSCSRDWQKKLAIKGVALNLTISAVRAFKKGEAVSGGALLLGGMQNADDCKCDKYNIYFIFMKIVMKT